MSADTTPRIDLTSPKDFLDQLHTEAGLVAVLLAIACIFLVWLWSQERAAVTKEREEHGKTQEKLYVLSNKMTEQLAVLSTTMDKVYQVFQVFLTTKKD